MAYNPNFSQNRGRKNGGSFDGRSRNDNRSNPPREIHPEVVPEDYVEAAEQVMREVVNLRPSITTSKIRNLLGLVTDIYNTEQLRREDTLATDSVSQLLMMRVRVLYEAGRDQATKTFIERAKLLEYLKGIGSSRADLIRFAHYMEALVAYHRYLGGRER